MGRLLFVRHGQTAGAWDDRDRLSPLGIQQGETLGRWWLQTGFRPERIYVGPRRRHQQTCDAALGVLREAGVSLPDPQLVPQLDEFQAELLFRVLLPRLISREPRVKALIESGSLEGPDGDRHLYRLLDPLGRAWARGDVDDPQVESWLAFVSRVGAAITQMRGEAPKGATVVAFTSAGPLAAATGHALGLFGEKVFELCLAVHHTAIAEFLFSSERFSLQAFNAVSHLGDGRMITLR